MTVSVNSPRYKWYLVGFLFCTVALNYADRTAISAVFPLLKRELGMSDLALGAIGSFFLWSYALLSPFAGYVGDRLPRSSLVSGSLIAWSAVTLVTGLVSTSHQLLAMRVLLGVAECLYLPAAIALIADYHSAQTRATAMAIHASGLYVGMIAGGALAGYLGDLHGWRSPLFVLGGVGFALGLLGRFLLFKTSGQEGRLGTVSQVEDSSSVPIWTIVPSLMRTPSYLVLLGEAMLIAIGVWIFINWLPLYFQETFHMSLAQAGFSGPFVIQSAAFVGILAGGIPSDYLARRNVKYRMLLQSICYFAAAPLLLSFLSSKSFSLIAASIFAFSLMQALGGVNEQPLLCEILGPKQRSTAIGIMNMMNSFVGGIAILIAGYLKRDFGLEGVFAGLAVIVLIAAMLLLMGYRFFLQDDLRRQAVRNVHIAFR